MKSSAGFTLLEVIIALGVMTSSIYVLSDVQMRAVRRVRRDREQVDRMYLIKKEWLQTFIKDGKPEDKPVKKNYTEPELKITTVRKPLTRLFAAKGQKDSAKKGAAEKQPLQSVVTEGSWKSGDFTEKIALVGMRYQAHEKKEKK